MILETPGPPKQVEVIDWGINLVNLKWIAPESDGGSPISAYLVFLQIFLDFPLG